MMDMYKCNKCNREFCNYNSQHGTFEIIEGKMSFSICKGLSIFELPEIEIETNNNEKDSICRR